MVLMRKSGNLSKNRIKKFLQGILIVTIASFVTIGRKVSFSGDVGGGIDRNNIENLSFLDIVVFCLVMLFVWGAFFLIKRYYVSIQDIFFVKKPYRMKSLYIWLVVLGILLVAWLPYLLSFAPGSVLRDSLSSVEQIFSGHYSNHHPVLFTLLVGVFIKIGVLFGNINIGVFLYSCFQSLILAMALSAVVVFLVKQGLSKILLIVLVAFFAICPIFPSYAIIMWKDPIFSIALLLLGMLLFDFARNNFSNMKWWKYVILVFLVFIIAFFRNNGLFILLLMIPLLLLIFKRSILKIVITISVSVVVAIIIQGPIYSVLHIDKPSVEAMSIPLQQIAWVITQDDSKFSNEDKEFLSEIMPIERWKEAYTPSLVDSIKWHAEFNTEFFESNLGKFMIIWLKNLPENFDGYVNAYLLETIGFWHPYYQNSYGYIDQYIADNDYGIHETDLIKKGFGVSVKERLMEFRPMISTGLVAIIMLFSMILILEFQNKRFVLLYITSLLCWMVIMVSTPVAFSLRYVFVMMLALPIFIAVPFSRNIFTKDDGY